MEAESIKSGGERAPSWLVDAPIVQRPRLLALLDEAAAGSVTFVSGPAGAGKSVLVDQWLTHHPERRSVRVDFDSVAAEQTAGPLPGDLISSVIEAISRHVGDLRSTDPADRVDRPLTAADSFAERWQYLPAPAEPLFVVIDCLSSGSDPDRLRDLSQFLDRLVSASGDDVHLVVVARRIPEPVMALMATGRDVAHIDADELACEVDEITTLARAHLGRSLDDDAVAALREQTGGWVTGVVAALTALVAPAGDEAAIAKRTEALLDDYFSRRVIGALPTDVAGFLVDVALMEGIDPSVCDAVMGRTDSRELLDGLARRLAFVRRPDPLLARYEIFGPLRASLVRRARRDNPRIAQQIGRAAATHLRARVARLEAVEELIADRQFNQAIDLLGSLAAPSMADVDIQRARELARQIPVDVVLAHPTGVTTLVAYAIDLGDVAQASRLLEHLDASADTATWTSRTLVHASRAALGRWHDDPTATVAHASEALTLLAQAPDEYPEGTDRLSIGWTRALVRIYGAGGLVRSGEIGDALAWFCHAERDAVGIPHLVARAMAEQAVLQARFGHLCEASALADRSEAITLHASPHHSVRPEVFQARALVATERNDLTKASQAIVGAQASDRGRIVPEIVARNTLLAARLAMAKGDFDAGLSLCGQWRTSGHRVGVGGLQAAIVATEIRLALVAGYIDHARRLGAEVGAPSELRGSLAWLDVATGDVRTLSVRVDTWPDSPLVAARIEFHLYGALRADLLGRAKQCADHLGAAACLAEPEGFYRVFLDGAPGIVDLAVRTLPRFPSPWLARLVWRLAPSAVPIAVRARPTARERQVLELLATELAPGAMAQRLGVSPSTLKSHLGRVYRKLGVSSRDQAVARALEFGVIAPRDDHRLARTGPED